MNMYIPVEQIEKATGLSKAVIRDIFLFDNFLQKDIIDT